MFSSGPLQNEVTPGYSAVVELTVKKKHSLLLHGGEVGLWKHDFALVGSSYRFQGDWLEFRLGYFYRMRQDSQQSAPMVSVGASI
jgi:hypothetical protein